MNPANPTSPRFAPPPSEHPPLSRALSFLFNPQGLDNPSKLAKAVAGQVILITGASYGLGEAAAQLFARAGAIVLMAARTADKLDSVAARIRAEGGEAHVYPTDLADPVSAAALAQRVIADHGRVDVLIHNAGKSLRRSIALSYDRYRDFERTMAINYHGPVALTLGLLPHMRSHGGHIVNVSTVGARIPPGPRWAAYQASKGAFDTWMRSVGLEMRSDNLTLTTCYMGLMYTRMSSPTPIMRVLPGLMPEEAALLLARAVVSKPAEISPPWLRPVEIGGVLLRGPVNWLMARTASQTGDSEASLSAAGQEV